MGCSNVLYALQVAVTFSLLHTGCWAGPIPINAPRKLKHQAPVFTEYLLVLTGGPRKSYGQTKESAVITPGSVSLTSRSSPSTDTGTGMSPTMIVVIGVVVALVAICLLVLIICLLRRRNRRHKVHQDPELQRGFGQYASLGGQQITSPPKTYHVRQSPDPPLLVSSQSPGSLTVEKLGSSPPIAVTQTSEGYQLGTPKPRGVPAPLLPRLPMSPAPKLPGLPKSPRPERRPTVEEHALEPHTPTLTLLEPSSQTDATRAEPLSGGGLEKLISRMELELEDDLK